MNTAEVQNYLGRIKSTDTTLRKLSLANNILNDQAVTELIAALALRDQKVTQKRIKRSLARKQLRAWTDISALVNPPLVLQQNTRTTTKLSGLTRLKLRYLNDHKLKINNKVTSRELLSLSRCNNAFKSTAKILLNVLATHSKIIVGYDNDHRPLKKALNFPILHKYFKLILGVNPRKIYGQLRMAKAKLHDTFLKVAEKTAERLDFLKHHHLKYPKTYSLTIFEPAISKIGSHHKKVLAQHTPKDQIVSNSTAPPTQQLMYAS